MGMQALYQHRTIWVKIFVFALFLLSACSQQETQPTVTTLPSTAPVVAPAATLAASPTTTPPIPAIIFLAPQAADQGLVQALGPHLEAFANQLGLSYQLRADLAPADLQAVRLVVALPPDPGLAALSAASVETQFLAVGVPGLQAGPNLSVIEPPGGRPDQLGFLAGFLAAAITEDWRTGILTEQGTSAGKGAANGFANGVTYFCGLCLPAYPPYPTSGYPLSFSLPASPNPADWQAALTEMQSWQVKTVFIYSAVATEELLQDVAEAGMQVILSDPPPESAQETWVATLSAGDPLQAALELIPDLLAGSPGKQVTLPLTISQANPDRLSPGRQRLAESMLVELLSGMIDTGVDPDTGELILR